MNATIYQIRHVESGKVYIGSSKTLTRRWKEHKYRLNIKAHHNEHLQRAWNKYGAEAFVFEVVQEVPLAEQIKAEDALILATPSERRYNKGCYSRPEFDRDEAYQTKVSAGLKRVWAEYTPEQKQSRVNKMSSWHQTKTPEQLAEIYQKQGEGKAMLIGLIEPTGATLTFESQRKAADYLEVGVPTLHETLYRPNGKCRGHRVFKVEE